MSVRLGAGSLGLLRPKRRLMAQRSVYRSVRREKRGEAGVGRKRGRSRYVRARVALCVQCVGRQGQRNARWERKEREREVRVHEPNNGFLSHLFHLKEGYQRQFKGKTKHRKPYIMALSWCWRLGRGG